MVTEPEALRLINALTSHIADMATLALETGLRESNVTLLRWEQVDFSQRIIYIEGEDILKSEQAFVVPLSDAAIDVIKRQIGNHHYRETFAREYTRVKMVKIHLIFVGNLANS